MDSTNCVQKRLFLSNILQENPECRHKYSEDSFFIGGNSVEDKERHSMLSGGGGYKKEYMIYLACKYIYSSVAVFSPLFNQIEKQKNCFR